jgi:CHAD domain-containing protein
MSHFIMPDSFNTKNFITELATNFSIKTDPSFTQTIYYYDTFDWLLYLEGFMLTYDSHVIQLSDVKSKRTIMRVSPESSTVPKFWWDFPDCQLKNKLKTLIHPRALLLMAEIKKGVQAYRLLNEDHKTILKINIETNEAKTAAMNFTLLIVSPVRGYHRDLQNFLQYVQSYDFRSVNQDSLTLFMSMLNKTPGDYSTKINIKLTPSMPVREALINTLIQLLNIMKQNEPRIIADIDTEFLHDFRVALRRSRSLLNQLEGIFPDKITTRFKNDLRYIASLSNRLRDLDVYLLKKTEYENKLPDYLKESLQPLFIFLAQQRQQELATLVTAMKSRKYLAKWKNWEEYLINKNINDLAENSTKPVNELANAFIYKKYKKILKLGHKVNNRTPDSELHILRIEGKKLRYLLEFFSSLYPASEISTLIHQLKTVQDILGNYNDLSTQQNDLKIFLEELTHQSADPVKISAAIGGLITSLNQEQEQLRNRFKPVFTEFSDNANYKKIFALL